MSAAPHELDCHQAVERLYEYLDRELTPEVQRDVERHLKACAGCFQRFEFERVYLRFLEAHARGRGATPEMKRRIARGVFEEEP